MARDDETAPRVVVQSHLDGDVKPRPEEIKQWLRVMEEYDLDVMVCLILTIGFDVGSHFPGYTEHWWELDRKGAVKATQVRIEVV